MAKVERQDVIKVADLIKIYIDELEVEHYQSQLNTVISAIDVLNELDTANITETSQTHGLINITSEDIPQKGLDISKYLNDKNLKNDYFVVNRFIG